MMGILSYLFGVSLVFVPFVVVLFYLGKAQNIRRAAGNSHPNSVWEDVPGGMSRTPVPGGWIYLDGISGHSIALAFVPKPPEEKLK